MVRKARVSPWDLTALLNAGVIDRDQGGGIVFPFEAVKVEFLLEAA